MVGGAAVANVHAADAEVCRLVGAEVVPGIVAAEIVLRAHDVLTGRRVAANTAVALTTAPLTGTTVFGTGDTVFGAVARRITTFRRADAAVARAVGAVLTRAARTVAADRDVPTADRAESLSLLDADAIPVVFAAERVHLTDDLGAIVVVAALPVVGNAAVTVASSTVVRTALAILVISTLAIAAERALPTILGTVPTALIEETLAIAAEGQNTLANRAVVGRFVGAQVIPIGLAAIGIDFADEIDAGGIFTARAVMSLAATALAGPTIIGTGFATLGLSTDTIAANIFHGADAALKRLHLVDAKVIPVDVAAVWVGGADAGLDGFFLAAGVAVGRAAIAIARAAFVGFGSAKSVPLHVAAVWVHGADASLDIGVGATRRAVR